MLFFDNITEGCLNILFKLLSNRVIYPSIITTTSAQLLKFFIDYYRNKQFNSKILFGMGGMPSSHAASVTSIVTALSRYEPSGLDSLSFGSSLVFAFIVMYDAAGIRRRAGEQAVIINKVVERLEDDTGRKIIRNNLKEVLGHTPIEVFMGAVFGFLMTWFICYVLDPIR